MLPQQFEKITTRGVVGMILAGLDTGPTAWIDDIAMRTSSDQASEEYAWLGNAPAMREFIEGRSPAELSENSFVISNKDYEGSFKVRTKDMRRDKTGNIQTRVNQMAERVLDHPAALMSTLLVNGESSPCYDKKFFFDTVHQEGDSGIQSNDIQVDISTLPTTNAGTVTYPAVEQMALSIMKGIEQMYGFKDDRGEPMNQSASQFTVMVPTTLITPTLQAVSQMLGEGGQSGTLAAALKGYFNIRVVPNLRVNAWTDQFAIFRTDTAAKPFILQEEGPPDVIALGDGSEYEQLNKEQLYGVDWTGNVGYGYWQFACLVKMI
jgi:phage major head subunit gpT-like protein